MNTICGTYCVMHGDSFTVIRFEDNGRNHYAQFGRCPSRGWNHGSDYLPGGPLYLGDTWDEAMKALGINEEVEKPDDDCP